MHFVDYYALLNLPPYAGAEEIIAAYQAKLEDPNCTDYELLVGINIAHLVLTNPRAKALYDVDYLEHTYNLQKQMEADIKYQIEPKVKLDLPSLNMLKQKEDVPLYTATQDVEQTQIVKKRLFRKFVHKARSIELTELLSKVFEEANTLAHKHLLSR